MSAAPDEAPEPEPLAALLARLGTSRAGLAAGEAAARLRERGRNEIAPQPLAARILARLRATANPLVVILLVAACAAAFLGEVGDAAIIAGIVLLSGALNFWQTFRSDRAVASLQRRIVPTATACRDGEWREVPRAELVVGDVIRLAAGDLVPADSRLVDAVDLHVQQAALTGESLPVEKWASPGAGARGPDAPDRVFLGTSIVSGSATAVIVATGADTEFGDIVERLAARPEETEFERGIRRFGMLILQTVLFLVLFILVVNVSLGRDALQSLLFSVALAVGLTPEFLPMIVTVTLARGALEMAREKVIVKHLSAIQNLGSIDVLCSDKTGTLTAGTMSLDASLDPFGRASDRALALAQLNSRFETGIRSPIDAAILARPLPVDEDARKTDEIPFDFERRRLSIVVERRGGTFLLVTKGAPEGVLEACSHVEADGEVRALDASAAARCRAVFQSASEQGYRVIAVAQRSVPRASGFRAADECELVLAGFLTFADHLIEGAADSIERLRDDGVAVKILTGDNEAVTRHLCAQVGIDAERIVLGRELEGMDEAALARVAQESQVFARVSPAQKHRVLRSLRSSGHVVGFLGDGINDAPSLHAADVGISVAGAVDVAREASDIILLERRLDVLHAGILAGRRSFGNVLKYLLMGTSSNFGNMFSMAGAALFLPFLPMLPFQILLNNFLYDFAQITIPSDRVDPGTVRRPQRWDMRLIRDFMLVLGPISSLYDFLTFYVLLQVFRFGEALFHTGWFLESLATQTLVLFVIRTAGRPWRHRPSLPLAVTTVLVVVVGAVLPYTPAAASLGFAPLPAGFFAFLAGVLATYLTIVELVKRRVLARLLPDVVRGPFAGRA